MLTEKEKKSLARYEQQLKGPKWKFILFHGVLSWGVLTAILYSIFMLVWGQTSFEELFRKDLWISLVSFMAGGILFGWFMHRFLPKAIKRLKDKGQLTETIP